MAAASSYVLATQKIQLWKTQKAHFRRICGIVQNHHCYLDTSPMGAGKTIVTLNVCKLASLKLFVVCPKSTASMWKNEADKYGVEVVNIYTYQMFAGKASTGCNHQYLDKTTDGYLPTEILTRGVNEGILFVFDEMHALKNPGTSAIEAAHSLVREVIRVNKRSRVALLSATPCDKEVHSQNVLKMLGTICQTKLYDYDQSNEQYIPTGILDLYDLCDKLNPHLSPLIRLGKPVSNKSISNICYTYYQEIIKDHFASAMPSPEIPYERDAKNGYYKMSDDDIEELIEGVNLLGKATGFDETTGTVNMGNGSFGALTRAMVKIESAKLNTLVRLANETLRSDPTSKVILYVWYIDSIKYLQKNLMEHQPLAMWGETKTEMRDRIISEFQADHLNHRVLISNAKVGGIGISLDDRYGNSERHLFMIPTYNFIDLVQATGRIHRGTTKSQAHIRFVYSKECSTETRILNAIAKKSEITRSMLHDVNGDDNESIVFPGDYEKLIEE